ncbi:hypothetical protein Mapa_017024 [Marchantia paleacea]|nr:hypothetical protein Mapa_017024 [Marchantia paleacea]
MTSLCRAREWVWSLRQMRGRESYKRAEKPVAPHLNLHMGLGRGVQAPIRERAKEKQPNFGWWSDMHISKKPICWM